MLLTVDDYSPEFGIYCRHGETKDVSHDEALNMCRNGDESTAPRDHTSSVNWAVKFARTSKSRPTRPAKQAKCRESIGNFFGCKLEKYMP